jgi:NET1-associated nuclear protein 1 (U3 small nucleolar RNA-associated protein 17)
MVKIYNPLTAERMSALPVPEGDKDRTVTALLLLPSNDLRLLVASMDGYIRLWDYLEGQIVKEYKIGVPVTNMAMLPFDLSHLYISTIGPFKEYANGCEAFFLPTNPIH